MKGFNNLKVGTKLGCGFGIVLILMSILVLFGIKSMGQIQDHLEHIVKNNNVKMYNANAAAKAFLGISNNLRMTDNEAAKIAQKDRIETERKIYGDAITKLKEMEDAQEGIQLIKNSEDAIVPAKAANKKFMELYIAKKTAEADAVLMNESLPLTQKILDEFDKVIKYEQQRNQTRYEEAVKAYKTATWFMFILAGIAIALAVLTAVFLTRGIVRPLNEGVNVANAVAVGDLTKNIDIDRK